jgi:hypothetical protein
VGINWSKTHARRARLALLEARTASPGRRMALIRKAKLEALEARDALASERAKRECLLAHPEAERALGRQQATARDAA